MWIPTGSTLLNLAISQNAYNGFKCGRVHRITGESSATKTGLAASAFFLGALRFDREGIPFKFIYDDAEQTFDVDYYYQTYPFMEQFLGDSLIVKTGNDASKTLEDFADSVVELVKECKNDNKIGFYFIDSLDSLPPSSEVDRFDKEGLSLSINAASKAILLSQFFQDNIQKLAESNVGLVMISQVRDAMNIGFGRQPVNTKRVSGGNAPQFYSSLVIYLKKKKEESITVGKLKQNQSVGMKMEAAEVLDIEFKIVKNKLGRPFLSGFFSFVIASGAIDDARDLVEFLKQVEFFEIKGSWVKYKDKNYRTNELEELVRSDIHSFRKAAQDLFLEQLSQTRQLSDISTLW